MPSFEASGFAVWLLLGIGWVVIFIAGLWLERRLTQMSIDVWLQPPWPPLPGTVRRRWRLATWFSRFFMLAGGVVVASQVLSEQTPGYDWLLWLRGGLFHAGLFVVTTGFAFWLAHVVTAAILAIFQNPALRNWIETTLPHRPIPASQESNAKTEPEAWGEPENGVAANPLDRVVEDVDDTPSPPATPPTLPPRDRGPVSHVEHFADTLSRIVGILLYLTICMPIYLFAADLWGWRTSDGIWTTVWVWFMPLFSTGGLILIAWILLSLLVWRLVPASQQRNGFIVAAILAVFLGLSLYSTPLAILLTAALVGLCWFARQDLSDLSAGLFLRMQRQPSVKTSEGRGIVQGIGALASIITTTNGRFRVRNRAALRSLLDGIVLTEKQLQPAGENEPG